MKPSSRFAAAAEALAAAGSDRAPQEPASRSARPETALASGTASGGGRIAVIGGGWSGLAAAVKATGRGHAVTLFEMAPQLGGRARQVDAGPGGDAPAVDNGQHILIGAYTETLRLMRTVGVDVDRALLRTPLRLVDPQGTGLQLPAGPPMAAFVRGVLAHRGWPLHQRLTLLAAAAGWWRHGFECSDTMTVAELCARLPDAVKEELIEPLCVAALNTPADAASARVFLRVLRDALFAGPGSADLLLPRLSLSALLPRPAAAWLAARGTRIALGQRVRTLSRQTKAAAGWLVDGEPFDAVVLAASAVEAARLVEPLAAGWAVQARSLRYEPIVTVYLDSAGARLPQPMLTLACSDRRNNGADSPGRSRHDTAHSTWPAQFVFDLGALGGPAGRLAMVASGAQRWVDAGMERTAAAALAQAEALLAPHGVGKPVLLRALTEKRATFRCTPGLLRPAQRIAAGLYAAGDYVDGPYPATLEGAVRSGLGAVAAAGADAAYLSAPAARPPPAAATTTGEWSAGR